MDLARTLTGLDGKGYGDYKRILGEHTLALPASQPTTARLLVDRVQVDPFAPPSLMRVILDRDPARIPDDVLADTAGRIATGDFLARVIARTARAQAGGERRSPRRADRDQPPPIAIGTPGQQVLERTSAVLTPAEVEVRITVDLPASGRRIRGRQAAQLLTETLPGILADALLALDTAALRAHVRLHRDQLHVQSRLADLGLVAFVGHGAILPRRSGDSDLPLQRGAVPFRSPESLRVTLELPHDPSLPDSTADRQVTGMGIPEGVTVIIGGGYHGKSTLLRAIERGVYPHIAGDGREWVLARRDATAIRAEDGRSVASVDISPFITGLPSGTDTRSFSTTNASGSTSQAATLIESIDTGAAALLIDEDTSATNFMIRDARMRRLIPASREPITPFVDRVRALRDERGVSTILVAGGSGAFFDVADHVIALDAYVPQDVTAQARAIAAEDPTPPTVGSPEATPAVPAAAVPTFTFPNPAVRIPDAGALRPADKRKFARARGRTSIQYGREDIDLSAVLQLVDPAQTQAIAHALERLADDFAADPQLSIAQALVRLEERLATGGLEALSHHRGHPGHLARPRIQEIAAALNRLRTLAIRTQAADSYGGSPA